jgi:hypothetical protein
MQYKKVNLITKGKNIKTIKRTHGYKVIALIIISIMLSFKIENSSIRRQSKRAKEETFINRELKIAAKFSNQIITNQISRRFIVK